MNRLVEPATVEDIEWLRELWKLHEPVLLGKFDRMWSTYRGSVARFGLEGPERFDVVQPALGFTRYRLNHYSSTLTLLGTAVARMREGVGRALDLRAQSFGYTILAVIDGDNTVSIAFRESLGYRLIRESTDNRTGKRVLVYERKPNAE
jgi:hypothetical protein